MNVSQNQSTDVNSSNNCELNSLDNLGDSSEELFRQFDGSFEIESLLSDLTEIKQEDNNNNLSLLPEHQQQQQHHQHHQLLSSNQQQNQFQQQTQYNQTETALLALAASVTAANSNQQHQQQISSLHRNYVSSTTGDNPNQNNSVNNNGSSSSSNNSNGSRYSIAANPLLAEKLLSPNSTTALNDLDNLSIGGVRSGRPPDLKGRWNLLICLLLFL